MGEWKGQDGTTISIFVNGKGAYKSGGTSVDGGTVDIDEAANKLSITLLSVGPTFKIDSQPKGNEMKLDGMIYKRTGGFSPDDSNASTGPGNTNQSSEKVAAPSDTETQVLVKKTTSALADAIESDDFKMVKEFFPKEVQGDDFEDNVREALKIFTDNKKKSVNIFRSAEKTNMTFSAPPAVAEEKGHNILTVTGMIASQPQPIKVTNGYAYQDGQWKLINFKYNIQ